MQASKKVQAKTRLFVLFALESHGYPNKEQEYGQADTNYFSVHNIAPFGVRGFGESGQSRGHCH
jgi:hypothetical protein